MFARVARARLSFLRRLFLDRSLQLSNFVFRKPSRFTRWQVERERTVADTANLLDMMANLFEHLAQLPVFALGQGDLIPGIRGFFNYANLRGCGAEATSGCSSLSNGDPFPQKFDRSFIGLAAHFHQICL